MDPTFQPYADAVASIESDGSGGYGALGPVTKNGDRAYGRYQVMGSNIPQWTAAATGQSMTPQEFLKNPSAQDAVFQHRFGSYLNQTGNPQDAASMWFSGRPLDYAGNSSDGYTTVPQYVAKFNRALGQPQAPMAQAMGQPSTMPDQGSYLFGGNPTPVGLLGGLGRALGIGSEDELGRRLQNAGAALMSVGNFGKPGMAGAAAMQSVANEPHYDVVSDALGNRYILDKRTGAISMPGMNSGAPSGMAPQVGGGAPGFNNQAGGGQQPGFKPSGDPTIDAVSNSPLGALERSKEQIEQSQKDKAGIEDSIADLTNLRDLAMRQSQLSQSPGVIQGPSLKTRAEYALGDHSGGTLGPMNIHDQGEFDTNNQQIVGLLGKATLNNARIAGPELRFLQMAHPNNDLSPEANQRLYAQIVQKVDRQLAHAQIARKYPVLGPDYYNEVQAYDRANPIYQGPQPSGTGSNAQAPISSFWQK